MELWRKIDKRRLADACRRMNGRFDEYHAVCWVENLEEAKVVAEDGCLIGRPKYYKSKSLNHRYGASCEIDWEKQLPTAATKLFNAITGVPAH
ncbi:MAG: hypothetical protein GXN93_04850 [Candidatus Diapherotrites archaeon]|nr:hypothetical protein [Candidatus Diapherotrites archaeon]